METFAKLERVQSRILQRIADLEIAFLPDDFSHSLSIRSPDDSAAPESTEHRLSTLLRQNGLKYFAFKRVPPDYYEWPLEARRDVIGAASVDHLCKSIVLVNTQAPANITDCMDRDNSKYYVVVVQYTARFNAEAVKNFLYTLNNSKIAKKKFNMRLAPEEISRSLTGYEHNGVTCIGMKTNIPVILDEAITKLKPDFFWLGGGEIDLKLRMNCQEFIDYVKPFIINCSGS
ncbi:unnamed protein product [Cuscuta epithymum]|uniref:YbaK/aminoacyl-tRNA synthetase-associated domain-containing protein n=1 Tax=Cuscuta epithymum TaxID=186058 RepID=A0AAV0DME6_9ASTE|nr:unnamed protein product [Cuscuta epithymum]